MKKWIFLILVSLISFGLSAQWVTKNYKTYLYPYGGWVGIGTDKMTAGMKMDILGNAKITGNITVTGSINGTITGGSSLNELLTNKKGVTSGSATFYYSCLAANAREDSIAALMQRIANMLTTSSVSNTKYYSCLAINARLDSIAALLARRASPAFTGAITGDASSRGTGAFGTTDERVAIPIVGGTSSDVYAINILSSNGSVRPGAGEWINYYPKTDSLIVTRSIGTTSALGFSYIRFK